MYEILTREVNLIPVIAKADTVTKAELQEYKAMVSIMFDHITLTLSSMTPLVIIYLSFHSALLIGTDCSRA
jgi:hypothetical protein